jgi:hypothetical protein
MTKKISIGARPTTVKPAPAEADQWVESRTPAAPEPEPDAPSKRLTIDIPADLHRRIKSQCALRGTKIADEVRELLLQKYGNP